MAFAFGSSVVFAQSSPQSDITSTEKTVYTLTIDKMSNRPEEEEAGRRAMSVYELPEIVLEQLKYSGLAGHTVISVAEVQPQLGDEGSPQYELILQDRPAQTTTESNLTEPNLLVRFDAYGEVNYKKEIPAAAIADQE